MIQVCLQIFKEFTGWAIIIALSVQSIKIILKEIMWYPLFYTKFLFPQFFGFLFASSFSFLSANDAKYAKIIAKEKAKTFTK